MAINIDTFVENEFKWLSTLRPFPASSERRTDDDSGDDLMSMQQLTLKDMFLLLQDARTG